MVVDEYLHKRLTQRDLPTPHQPYGLPDRLTQASGSINRCSWVSSRRRAQERQDDLQMGAGDPGSWCQMAHR